MNIHAIQTGSVRIKTAQVEGHGHGLARRLAVFTDRNWTDWLPTYAWAIEHRDRVIVVDTVRERTSWKPANHCTLISDGRSSFGLTGNKR